MSISSTVSVSSARSRCGMRATRCCSSLNAGESEADEATFALSSSLFDEDDEAAFWSRTSGVIIAKSCSTCVTSDSGEFSEMTERSSAEATCFQLLQGR